MKISDHIDYLEATHTGSGLPNIPDIDTLKRMQYVANNLFEPIRVHFNCPIHINSFYRSIEVNHAIGGATNSQHTKGEAIDIACPTISTKEIFDYVHNHLNFDQCIIEPSWVHISLKYDGNRKETLKAVKVNGKMTYQKYPI